MVIYNWFIYFMRAYGPRRYWSVERNLIHIRIFYSLKH